MTTGSWEERFAAIEVVEGSDPAQWSRELTRSISNELLARRADFEERWRRGARRISFPSLSGTPLGAYLLRLMGLAVRAEDPVVINALCTYVDWYEAGDGLARFGELAVPCLTRVAGDWRPEAALQATFALKALLAAYRSPDPRYPLSYASIATLVSITRHRLSEPGSMITLAPSVELAVALNRPELLSRVEEIIADSSWLMNFPREDGSIPKSLAQRQQDFRRIIERSREP